MAALNRKLIRLNYYIRLHTDINAIPTALPMFSGSVNGTCIYTVRLNWEETGSGKFKKAAYIHEISISQLPD